MWTGDLELRCLLYGESIIVQSCSVSDAGSAKQKSELKSESCLLSKVADEASKYFLGEALLGSLQALFPNIVRSKRSGERGACLQVPRYLPTYLPLQAVHCVNFCRVQNADLG